MDLVAGGNLGTVAFHFPVDDEVDQPLGHDRQAAKGLGKDADLHAIVEHGQRGVGILLVGIHGEDAQAVAIDDSGVVTVGSAVSSQLFGQIVTLGNHHGVGLAIYDMVGGETANGGVIFRNCLAGSEGNRAAAQGDQLLGDGTDLGFIGLNGGKIRIFLNLSADLAHDIGNDGIKDAHHEFVDVTHLVEGRGLVEFVYNWG